MSIRARAKTTSEAESSGAVPSGDRSPIARRVLGHWTDRTTEPVPAAVLQEADQVLAVLATEPTPQDLMGLAAAWGQACRTAGMTLFQALSLFTEYQEADPENRAVGKCLLLVSQLWVDEQERRLQDQLESKTEDLVRANRCLREKDKGRADFISSYSHELRTPLTAIMGACELLLEDFADELSGPQTEYMDMINQSALLMRQLIDDVLDYEKLEVRRLELHIEPLCPKEVITDVFTLVSPLLQEKAIRWVQETGEDLPLVLGDAVRLRQILLNLVSNAIKFTPRHGTITVRAALEKAAGRRGAALSLAIADSGPGIALENQRLIFERFKQVYDRTVRGSGLGLPIAKRLAELHGGKLSVHSVPGEGATFYLTMPVAPEAS